MPSPETGRAASARADDATHAEIIAEFRQFGARLETRLDAHGKETRQALDVLHGRVTALAVEQAKTTEQLTALSRQGNEREARVDAMEKAALERAAAWAALRSACLAIAKALAVFGTIIAGAVGIVTLIKDKW
ncbi:MAG: hypothetical protein Kow0032_07230 [Methyloligellaceae bacterium]